MHRNLNPFGDRHNWTMSWRRATAVAVAVVAVVGVAAGVAYAATQVGTTSIGGGVGRDLDDDRASCPGVAFDYERGLGMATGRIPAEPEQVERVRRLLAFTYTPDFVTDSPAAVRPAAETVRAGVDDAQDGTIRDEDLARYVAGFATVTAAVAQEGTCA
ncbi:MAG TPA: hypothetical protein VFU19_17955 [Iamia sp.]|nr:hypothetical protein [Iamia sp.]